MLKVLSTKLLDESLVDDAHEQGIALTCEDFIRVHNLDFDISLLSSIQYDAIVFTSSNAVKSFLGNENINASDHKEPVYAISGKTKDELEDYNITPLDVADNALQLADKILANENIRSVLHICGNLKLDILENKLSAANVRYTPFTVCETILNSIVLAESYDVIMFYSPSGIDSFLLKNKLDQGTLYCCIGDTTAEKLKSIDADLLVIVPVEPTPEAMLTLIKDYKNSDDI